MNPKSARLLTLGPGGSDCERQVVAIAPSMVNNIKSGMVHLLTDLLIG
jgi:hypothetical protein